MDERLRRLQVLCRLPAQFDMAYFAYFPTEDTQEGHERYDDTLDGRIIYTDILDNLDRLADFLKHE